jgi:tetratricopeptide (TPR) repeat protein
VTFPFGQMLYWVVIAAWLSQGCRSGDDRERRGDRAYGQARYAQALAEYRAVLGGRSEPRLWAKTAAAALHAGELQQAAEGYLRLASEDPTRATEAAEGLESVARAAERRADTAVLRKAVQGLQAIAPDRPPGRYALLLAQRPDLDNGDLVALLPGAIATAADPKSVDSLLALYGSALQATAGCGQALPQFRAILRRTQDTTIQARARARAADCAWTLGRRAEFSRDYGNAVLWFAEAARMDSTSPTGRRALLAYGDNQVRRGDILAAAIAFQAVVTGTEADSAGQVAKVKLAGLGSASSSGSPLTGQP